MAGIPLLCWDDSRAAASAVRGVAALLPEPRRAVVAFAYLPDEAGRPAADTPRMTAADAEAVVERGVRAAQEAGIEAIGLPLPARVTGGALVAAADEREATMLVLGQPPRSELSRFLLGSVARDVVRDAHQPVVLVAGPADGSENPGAGAAPAPGDGPVLLCWDGSDGALQAMRDARAVAGDRRAIVLFAHVPTESAAGILGGVSAPDGPIMGEADAEHVVQAGVEAARREGWEPSPLRVVAERRTADIIAAAADEHDAPLIAMGQRRRSALGTLILGSVARGVLAAHHRPVLLSGPESPGLYPHRR